MGWYCMQIAERHTDSDVAKVMSYATPNGSRPHFNGNGIMIGSKALRVAWVKAYEISQRSWINDLKSGTCMSQPKEWYFKALKAALKGPRYERMCMNLMQCGEESVEAGMTASVDTMS